MNVPYTRAYQHKTMQSVREICHLLFFKRDKLKRIGRWCGWQESFKYHYDTDVKRRHMSLWLVMLLLRGIFSNQINPRYLLYLSRSGECVSLQNFAKRV